MNCSCLIDLFSFNDTITYFVFNPTECNLVLIYGTKTNDSSFYLNKLEEILTHALQRYKGQSNNGFRAFEVL